MATLTEFRWSMLRGWLLIIQNPLSFWQLDEWNGNRPISTVFSVNSRRSALASPMKQLNVKVVEENTDSTKVELLSPNQIKQIHWRNLSLASTAISSNATTIQPNDLHLSISTQMSNEITKPGSVSIRQTASTPEYGTLEKRKRDTFGHNTDGFYHHGEEIDVISTIPKVDEDIEASAQDPKVTEVKVEVKKEDVDDTKDDNIENKADSSTSLPLGSSRNEPSSRKTI